MGKITLAGQEYEISQPPFGKLRKIISSFSKIQAAGGSTEAAMDESAQIFAVLLGKSVDEIDAMTITLQEVVVALAATPELCGLVTKVGAADPSGEAPAA